MPNSTCGHGEVIFEDILYLKRTEKKTFCLSDTHKSGVGIIIHRKIGCRNVLKAGSIWWNAEALFSAFQLTIK